MYKEKSQMMKFYFEITNNQIIIIFALQKPSKLIQYNKVVSKVGDFSRGWLESFLFDSYYTKV